MRISGWSADVCSSDLGDGLCDQKVVEIVVKEGPERVREIIGYGADFDRDNTGKYDLARDGGHSESRVLHYKDVTGLEIERTLLDRVHQNPDIERSEEHTSEHTSLMRISYAGFCLKKKKQCD